MPPFRSVQTPPAMVSIGPRPGPTEAADLTRRFQRPPAATKMRAMLETLAVLGQARRDADGRYRT